MGRVALGLLLLVAGAAGCGLLKSESKKPFGEECTTDADCESLECATYGSICTKSCTYDADCGSGLVCRAKDVGSGNQCSKASGTAPNGSCASAQQCDHGICLKKAGETEAAGVCSKYCASADECPDGMKICEAIEGSASVKMCLPGDAAAPPEERPTFVAPKPTVVPTKTTAAAAASASPDAGTAGTALGAAPAADAGPAADAALAAADAGAPADAGAAQTATSDAGRPFVVVAPGLTPTTTPTATASVNTKTRPKITISPPKP